MTEEGHKGSAVLWDETPLEVVAYDAEDEPEATEVLKLVLESIRSMKHTIEKAVVDDLLGIYNGGYAQPDDGLPELDAVQFLASLPPTSIRVSGDVDEWSAVVPSAMTKSSSGATRCK